MNNYIIIPARMESKRLPGKPLLDKTGKYLIQHTWESCRVVEGIDDVIIATSDMEIMKACESFGATVIVTHEAICGTQRAAWAAEKLIDPGYLVVVQAEYPHIHHRTIEQLIEDQEKYSKVIQTVAYYTLDKKEFNNPNRVKVVVDSESQAMYFSRAGIPYNKPDCEVFSGCWIHAGIYGVWAKPLIHFYNALLNMQKEITLALIEDLEQLRWQYLGIPLQVKSCEVLKGIDSMEDYREFVTKESWKPSQSE